MNEHPDPECSAILAHLGEFLDGECVEVDADSIRAHLEACDRCVEDADIALALKALVKRCCGAEHAPQGLRSRIMTTYSVTYVEYTTMRPLED